MSGIRLLRVTVDPTPRSAIPPSALPRVKKAIRSVTIQQCKQIAQRVRKLEAARDVDLYLTDRLESLVPELIVK